jgi:predicted enzyme related to lactoylglutathione lyase
VKSPIENRIGQVFVPVSDMARSARWYSTLLGIEESNLSHEGMICDIPMQGDPRLSLDGHPRPLTNSSQPLFYFWCQDIHAAIEYLANLGVDTVGTVTDAGSVSFLIFRDPDQNLLMVCQRN